jgi:hypothetical protein
LHHVQASNSGGRIPVTLCKDMSAEDTGTEKGEFERVTSGMRQHAETASMIKDASTAKAVSHYQAKLLILNQV